MADGHEAARRAEAIRILTDRPKFGAGLGLQRMQAILADLPRALWCAGGRPIHVTGSQGKGTVTILAAALLDVLGYKTGRFISPHLMRIEERIAIGGVPIGADAFAAAARAFQAREAAYLALNPGDRFGAFEALTAAAYYSFTAADVDVAVIEAGIGGRFDSTRSAGGAVVALTGIDQEHSALLGPTEEHILYDKADLCPAGGLLIAGRLPAELKRRLGAYGAIRGFDILYTEEVVSLANLRHGSRGALADLTVDGLVLNGLETRVFGRAQLFNVALALLVVRAWLARKGRATDDKTLIEAARTAFAQTVLPLRFEKLGVDPTVIVDVAHTPSAARALAATVRDVLAPAHGIVLLAGIADDKPAHAVLEPLAAIASAIVCTQSYRGLPADILAGLPPAKADRPCLAIADPKEAYAEACRLAQNMGMPLLVTGSVFLAAAVKCIAAGEDPAALEFL
jgi:dihydrofolate synthase/folylpolyglutamate synthase